MDNKSIEVHEAERPVLYDHRENEIVVREKIGFRAPEVRPADAAKDRGGGRR